MGHGLIQERKLVPEASLSPVPFTEPDTIRYCPPFRRDIPISRADHPCLTHPFATLPGDCSPFTSDLHVLGTPPAFVLSQDQTLQICSCPVLAERSVLFLAGPSVCCSYLVVNDPRRTVLRSGRPENVSVPEQPCQSTHLARGCQPPPPLPPFRVRDGLLLIGLSPSPVNPLSEGKNDRIQKRKGSKRGILPPPYLLYPFFIVMIIQEKVV